MTIQLPALTSLNSNELYGFANDVQCSLNESFSVVPLYARQFLTDISSYHEAMLVESVDRMTDEIAAADRDLDHAWIGMKNYLKAFAAHPSEAVRDACDRVSKAFDPSDKPTHRPYDVESGMIERLIARLNALEPSIIEAAQAKAWIDALIEQASKFRTLYQQRLTLPKREAGLVRQARVQLINSIRILFQDVNSQSRVSPSGELSNFIAKADQLCDALRVRLKTRKTKAQNAASQGVDDTAEEASNGSDGGSQGGEDGGDR